MHSEPELKLPNHIFHATYAVLHHPEYRTRYAANHKRELPRIPFLQTSRPFAAVGKRLSNSTSTTSSSPSTNSSRSKTLSRGHLPRRTHEAPEGPDRTPLHSFLTLRGIPPAAFDYRIGNRSVLEWVIDQYRVSTDPRSGITNDPNRTDDSKYILRLIGQVITVSLETQQIITALPSLNLGSESATGTPVDVQIPN